MKLRPSTFARLALAAVLSTVSYGQTLPDQLAAAANAGELNKRGAPSGLNAAAKAKNIKALADKRAATVPFAAGMAAGAQYPSDGQPKLDKFGNVSVPVGPEQKQMMQPELPGQQQQMQAPPVEPAPEPWLWRLKGLVTGANGKVATFLAPDGRMVFVRAGDRLDDRSTLVKIAGDFVVVKVDDVRVDIRPW